MDNITIEGSPKTPTVNFDAGAGLLEIKGRSIPENSIEFYKPLLDWIEAYASVASGTVKVVIQLEYFNTSSSKCILDVFKKLEGLMTGGADITIFWHYEEDDEDMLEAGEDYEAIINIPFKMIEIEEE
jgi:hypothetical protein